MKKIGKVKVKKNQNVEKEATRINRTKMETRRNFRENKIAVQMKKRVTVQEMYYSLP